MSQRRALFLLSTCLIAGLSGCSQPLTDEFGRRDEVLSRYFTEDAAAVLREIPLRTSQGEAGKYRGIAIGDDPITRLAGVLLGLGNTRQVVVRESSLDDDGLIIHEYLHQADYSGLVDRRFFLDRFDLLRADPNYGGYAIVREHMISESYGSSIFGRAELLLFDGINTELVAFVGRDIAMGEFNAPDYLQEPFAGALRIPGSVVLATSPAATSPATAKAAVPHRDFRLPAPLRKLFRARWWLAAEYAQ